MQGVCERERGGGGRERQRGREGGRGGEPVRVQHSGVGGAGDTGVFRSEILVVRGVGTPPPHTTPTHAQRPEHLAACLANPPFLGKAARMEDA